ncbi:MAG TPA: MFS transporter, partial [Rhodobacteraceae bacterium]|nr:MFS transporter [Paracoccaceae bacterium]
YSMMNLVMTSTPLAVIGCGFSTSDVADIVSAHVLAMFVPSFFTGHLIVRFGARRILAIGLVMLAIAGLCALEGIDLGNFFAALIMVGLGWNFSFIGATTLLSESHKPHERGRVQGMNDFFVGAGVTLASLTSGGLMNCSGNSALEGWAAVNLAMLPLLFLAALALFFLTKTANRPKDYK